MSIIMSKRRERFLTLCHTWDSDLRCSNPESMGIVATPGGDLLNDQLEASGLEVLLDDLLTPCAGILRTISCTIKL